jgi:hypothetical protein
MEQQLMTLILADSGVSSAVGTSVFWNTVPQAEDYPLVLMTRVGGFVDYHSDGPSGLVESRVQLDCYSETYLQARSIADAVVAFVNTLKRTESGAIRFNAGFVVSQDARFEVSSEGSRKLHRVVIDATIWHSAAS